MIKMFHLQVLRTQEEETNVEFELFQHLLTLTYLRKKVELRTDMIISETKLDESFPIGQFKVA